MKSPMNPRGLSFDKAHVLLSVQPRIRLTRSFDQRSHTYLGYTLNVRGRVGSEAREFLVGVGQGVHAKHQFQAGTVVSGVALPVTDPRLETVEFYKVSKLKIGLAEAKDETMPPPMARFPTTAARGKSPDFSMLSEFLVATGARSSGCRAPA